MAHLRSFSPSSSVAAGPMTSGRMESACPSCTKKSEDPRCGEFIRKETDGHRERGDKKDEQTET